METQNTKVSERFSVGLEIQDRGFNSQPEALALGVAFFATGPGWVLKCISF